MTSVCRGGSYGNRFPYREGSSAITGPCELRMTRRSVAGICPIHMRLSLDTIAKSLCRQRVCSKSRLGRKIRKPELARRFQADEFPSAPHVCCRYFTLLTLCAVSLLKNASYCFATTFHPYVSRANSAACTLDNSAASFRVTRQRFDPPR